MRLALIASIALSLVLVAGAASCGAKMCTPQSCASGCCSATGECLSGTENASCGSGGNSCLNCTATALVCGINKTCGSLSTEDAGTDAGVPDAGIQQCGPTAVECADQAIQELDLKMNVSTGNIVTVADGTGFKSTIGAAAGGLTPTESYVYARFGETELTKVQLSDVQALDSTNWDIAFRRFVIRMNSGDSGPSCVVAQAMPPGTTYESTTSVPANYLPKSDDFLPKAPACLPLIPDGSGLGTSPNTTFAGFYQYAGCVKMTGLVYVLTTSRGRHVRMQVTSYYDSEAAQQMCNNTNSSGGALGGTIRVRWQYMD